MLKAKFIRGNKRYIVLLFKTIITVALMWMIYRRLFVDHQFNELIQEFGINQVAGAKYYLLFCLILLFVNWGLEAFRWKLMVDEYHSISFAKAFQGIMVGLTFGIVSPQRVGEFAGRLMVLPVEKNWLSIRASLYGSIAMNIIVVFCGILSYLFIQSDVLEIIPINLLYFAIIPSLVFIVAIFIFFPVIEKKLRLSSLTSRIQTWGNFNEYQFRKITLFKVLLISFFRYSVFVLQYFLVIQFIGIEVEPYKVMSLISIIYLIQAVIPLPGLLNLVARGEIAMAAFSLYSVNEISILVATFTLWIINLLLPSLFGLGLLWRIPILKSLGIDK